MGLTHATTRADLTRAVLEGVAFALADGQQALLASGTSIGAVSVIGGGARSRFWGRILATVLDRPLRELDFYSGVYDATTFGFFTSFTSTTWSVPYIRLAAASFAPATGPFRYTSSAMKM